MVWDAWLDLVTGSRCTVCERPGRLLCPGCRAELPTAAVPVEPDPAPVGLAPTFAVGDYADPLRALILAHKERRAFALAGPLGAMLADAVGGCLSRPGLAGASVLLVPVPSRPAVVASRDHDPTLRMTRVAARVLRREGVHAQPIRLLRQVARVADQAGLGAETRRRNLDHAMGARSSALRRLARSGRPVVAIVCDDVITTGSTLLEAGRALQAAGVPVAGAAVVAATRRRSVVRPVGETAAEWRVDLT